FDTAKQLREKDRSKDAESERESPQERFEAVAPLLDNLSDLALLLDASKKRQDLHHVALEIARTRADIYLWVAYDPARLDKPVDEIPRKEGEKLKMLPDSARLKEKQREARLALVKDEEKGEEPEGEAVRFADSRVLRKVPPDAARAWALRQAEAICGFEDKGKLNFDVIFALAEAQFMLCVNDAEATFTEAEKALGNEFGDYLEKRKKVSLRESSLICHSRLLYLRKDDEQKKEYETRQVGQAEQRAREAVSDMRQGRVTVFSQIQKRNINRSEMLEEIEAIVEQDELEG
ncbi:MAG TPA: hypothetical protein VNM38_13125, partial [Solirubrobacterales bacterium]|nr:hypothetical protein [Solirubrobacterales bacterium]